MAKPKVEYWESEHGDWERIIVDGQIHYDGHRARAEDWISLLEKLGAQVEVEYEVEEERFTNA